MMRLRSTSRQTNYRALSFYRATAYMQSALYAITCPSVRHMGGSSFSFSVHAKLIYRFVSYRMIVSVKTW